MPIDFPNAPANGATYSSGGLTYTYITVKQQWQVNTALTANVINTALGYVAYDGTTNPSGFATLTNGHLYPGANATYDLGSTTLRWRNIYTNDLQLSNGIGDYTIVEGENDLFLYNNRSGKTYKFLIQEVDPSTVPPKTPQE